jgi:hypothetical protein
MSGLLALAGIVVVASAMSTWFFVALMVLSGAALAYVISRLVVRGLYVPPTVLLDDAKARMSRAMSLPDEAGPASVSETKDATDEQ